jgi:hypothetical protein
MNYLKYKKDIDDCEYRNGFFKTMFYSKDDDMLPFVWGETKKEYELYINNSLILTEGLINYFQKLQADTKKSIACFSRTPLITTSAHFQNNHKYYVKFSFFKNSPLVIKGHSIFKDDFEVVNGFDKNLDSKLAKILANEPRLWNGDCRMKEIIKREFIEFNELKGQCDHCYVSLGERPVGYISGLRMDEKEYCHPFYLVVLIWIESSLDCDNKRMVASKLLDWLNNKLLPYAAGIYSCNLSSINFFSKNGFKPYFARFFPW